LDGEMVIVDGQFFQVRSDGSVRECGDDVLTPFAVITRFAPDAAVTMDQCPDMSHLTSGFDALRNSDNIFFDLRVDGQFNYVHTRASNVILDGFDLGAGVVQLLVAKSSDEKAQVLRSIGPVWDGNEVWLIAAGGAMFLAFPALYASSFSGFYLALM